MQSSISKVNGFTLIELIVVIVILGIMAAIAGPKFVSLQQDARISVMKGLEGGIRSAATLAYSKSLMEGEEGNASDGTAASQVTMGGIAVNTDFGYPDATTNGIMKALDISPDFESTAVTAGPPGTITIRLKNKTDCLIVYTEADSATVPIDINTTAVNTTNC